MAHETTQTFSLYASIIATALSVTAAAIASWQRSRSDRNLAELNASLNNLQNEESV